MALISALPSSCVKGLSPSRSALVAEDIPLGFDFPADENVLLGHVKSPVPDVAAEAPATPPALAGLVATISPLPARVTWWSVAVALGLGVSVGIVFGVYPAVRAAKLDPVVALRYE